MKNVLDHITEILLLFFLIITFLQSAFDKITDWKGNVSWLKEHFSKTFIKNGVPLALFQVLLIELVAGVLCTIGLVLLITNGEKTCALYGAIFSCVALLMLLFGQRLAKDYDGARTIAIYFAPAIFTVFLLAR